MKCFKNKKEVNERPSVKDEVQTKVPDKKYPLRLFYPDAHFFPELPTLSVRYNWEGKLPEIFVVHFTAGWQNQKPIDFMKSFIKRGLCTYFMDENGQVYQQHHGDTGGGHVGTSKWNGRNTVSSFAGGIEIACGGKLKKHSDGTYRTWFNKKISETSRRKVGSEYREPGYYEVYTAAQETELAKFLAWLLRNGVKEIVGHDDVSPGRKNDPGGSLSLPLNEFVRQRVKPLV